MQDAGCRMQDAGCRVLGAGCRMQDTGCLVLSGSPIIINIINIAIYLSAKYNILVRQKIEISYLRV